MNISKITSTPLAPVSQPQKNRGGRSSGVKCGYENAWKNSFNTPSPPLQSIHPDHLFYEQVRLNFYRSVFDENKRLPNFRNGELTFKTNLSGIGKLIALAEGFWKKDRRTPKITFFNRVQYMGNVQGGRFLGTGTLIWLLSGCQLLATFNGCSISGEAVFIDNLIAFKKYFDTPICLGEDHVFSLVDIRRLFTSKD